MLEMIRGIDMLWLETDGKPDAGDAEKIKGKKPNFNLQNGFLFS